MLSSHFPFRMIVVPILLFAFALSGQRSASAQEAKAKEPAKIGEGLVAPELEGGVAWLNTGKPLTLKELRGKIVHLQLSDADGTLNETGGSTHVPLGQGKINFELLMPELLNAGVPNDWWCVDVAYWPDAWAVTSESKRFLDKLRHKYSA